MMEQNNQPTYIVVGSKPWSYRIFCEVLSDCPGRWIFFGNKAQLTLDSLDSLSPRYIFFLHWSWLVPDEIIDKYECICFHMTDLPYGRGGSPLQNLIMRGYRQTKLSALRMIHELDAGPVYMKRDLCLEGNAEEIYVRASYLSSDMIMEIIKTDPVAAAQSGKIVTFERRLPRQSAIPKLDTLMQLYDFIRMLDAKGYPHAFIESDGYRYELSRANIYNGHIWANVKITPAKGE